MLTRHKLTILLLEISSLQPKLKMLLTVVMFSFTIGSIRNFAQGIEITENASTTTLSIALMLDDEVLVKNRFSIRVDHRTLKVQKEEVKRRGDKFLAQLFDCIPEKYINVISI